MVEPTNLDAASALALLRWHIEAGADEALAQTPLNRLAAPSLAESSTPTQTQVLVNDSITQATAAAPGKMTGAPSGRHHAQAAHNLEELRQAVESFDGCASLRRFATQTVFGDGNPRARIVLVGEAPGADEDRIGRPFVGASGKLLDLMLASIGLNRADTLYIMNVLYWRPPGNRHPTAEEIALCLPFVERQIELIAPDILIACGSVAGSALLARQDGITRYRGRWLNYQSAGLPRPIPAMAIYHPAFLLRQPARKRETWQDLLAIQEKAQEAGLLPT